MSRSLLDLTRKGFAFDPGEAREYRTVTPDVVLELKSDGDAWRDVVKTIDPYRADGCRYRVAIDADARMVCEAGAPPPGLALDLEAMFDA